MCWMLFVRGAYMWKGGYSFLQERFTEDVDGDCSCVILGKVVFNLEKSSMAVL